MPEWTKTEVKILNILADGHPHPREELFTCIDDDLANLKRQLAFHVCNIRRKLKPYGQTIVCQIGDAPISYRHVILLSSGNANTSVCSR